MLACDGNMVVEQQSESESPPDPPSLSFLDGSAVSDDSSDHSPPSFPATTSLTKESSNTGNNSLGIIHVYM